MNDQIHPTPDDEAESDDLQFDRAEYDESASGPAKCAACSNPIEAAYFEINGRVTCGSCRSIMEEILTGGSRWRRFLRASVSGVIAAALGSAIYFLVVYLSGYEFALVAIVVGLLVGGAVRWGCNNRGGWFYQFLAMFLTYTAIVSIYIPAIFEAMTQLEDEEAQTTAVTSSAPAANDTASDTQAARDADAPLFEDESTAVTFLLLLVLAVLVMGMAYAVPILAIASGESSFIGLLIIGFALYEAWRINKRPSVQITGPYEILPESSTAPPPTEPERG